MAALSECIVCVLTMGIGGGQTASSEFMIEDGKLVARPTEDTTGTRSHPACVCARDPVGSVR